MTNNKDSDRAFWSIILDYSRFIDSIYRFTYQGVCNHFPVLSKSQFNIIKRVSKCAHDLGQLACCMQVQLNDNER